MESPAASSAARLIRKPDERRVVEVCSAAFYMENDPGVLVSACLFGDGAAAAVLSLEPGYFLGGSADARSLCW